MIIIHFDGSFREPKPGGRFAWAWVATRDDEEIAACSAVRKGDDGTTNVLAEFFACYKAAKWAHANAGEEPVRIVGDCQPVIDQITGFSFCRRPVWDLCKAIRRRAHNRPWTFLWVPRAENNRANTLVRRAWGVAWRAEHERELGLSKAERRAVNMARRAAAMVEKERRRELAMAKEFRFRETVYGCPPLRGHT